MTEQNGSADALPSVKLSDDERQRLASLAAAAMNLFPDAAEMLQREAERASVLQQDEAADQVARMHSLVRFVDGGDGMEREVQLVYPSEADISQNRISVLSLVGAALIGLSPGQEIPCPTRGGMMRLLKVTGVRQPGPGEDQVEGAQT